MVKHIHRVTRSLTRRYLLALGLVGLLALANYWVLRAEMRANEVSVELLTLSGRQRTLLQSTALMAEALVSVFDDAARREELLRQLAEATQALEQAHFRLIDFDPTGSGGPPIEVQVVYESSPWLLDTEIRNYLIQLRELTRSDEEKLNYFNPHFRYVQQVALQGDVMNGLEEVVRVYQRLSEQRASQLRWLAQFSFGSTVAVLALSGLLVFRPMVQLVQRDIIMLNQLNETLESRVAERTAVAEQRARDLAASEALYQSLVESLPLGVARTDPQGKFIYVNQVFCKIVQRSPEALQNTTPAEVFADQYLAVTTPEEVTLAATAHVVQRWKRLPGAGTQWVETMSMPIAFSAEQSPGRQWLLWDVTDRQAAEDRMLRAERLAAVGEMMTGVAHESRNALQQINACAKMLEWELESNPEAVGLVADIHQAHERLHRLFENLRGYVSPVNIAARRTFLPDVFLEAWKSITKIQAERQAVLRVQGTPELCWCQVDPFQLEQVFRNILENAMLACQDPTEIIVDWRLESPNKTSHLRVCVADNGPGMTDEVQAKIFDPFFTTRTQGTGLGMAIARRIIEAHGGKIEAHRRRSKSGTEICLVLPQEFV